MAIENCKEIVRENPEGNRQFLGGGTHWNIILKWILMKFNGRIWVAFKFH
jgi:hypothetical protein